MTFLKQLNEQQQHLLLRIYRAIAHLVVQKLNIVEHRPVKLDKTGKSFQRRGQPLRNISNQKAVLCICKEAVASARWNNRSVTMCHFAFLSIYGKRQSASQGEDNLMMAVGVLFYFIIVGSKMQ